MATHVPTSEYRARLRQWHERARAGEALVITENGQPVVRVVAAGGESVLDRLERDGLLRRARPRRSAASLDRVPAPGDSAETVSGDRDR